MPADLRRILARVVADRLSVRVIRASILVLSFVMSRVAFWLVGIRYDASSLGWFWQYLDVPSLEHRLLSALFFLHSQPPGFNLLLGVLLKAFPDSSAVAFQVVYLCLGFVLYCSLYVFLRLSQFSPLVALLCSFLYIVSPNSILYENWLFYTYPISVLLVVAAAVLRRFQDDPRALSASAFLLIVSAICLTRSSFHLVFLLACIPLVFVPRRVARRKVAACSLVAISLVGALYLKNLCVFGFFGPSSWMGMNMFKNAAHAVGTDTVAELVRGRRIPPVALVNPFSSLEAYPEYQPISTRHMDILELTSTTKASGHPNYNHEVYLQISTDYRIASLYIFSHYPRLWSAAMFDAWLLYCRPSWENDFLTSNEHAISSYIRLLSSIRTRVWISLDSFRRAAFGVDRTDNHYPLTGLLFLPSIVLVVATAGAVHFHRTIRYRDTSRLAFVFMTLTVLYVAVLGNAVEFGENNRFRVETDPLIFLLCVIVARDAYMYALNKWFNPRRDRDGCEAGG